MRYVVGAALLLLVLTAPAAPALQGFDPRGTGPGYPDSANGRKTEPPSLSAHRIANGGIRVDGRLDETDWVAAPAATGFTQFEPDRRGEPCDETVFKVLYDDDAVYVGVANYRHNGDPVTSCLARRDGIHSSDRIRVYLSPYHDMVSGYHFRINPDGVMEDYYNYGDLYHDISWDTVWEADTRVDDEGWYAEMRIPFSSIRYRPEPSMTWGFNVFQFVQSRGQSTAWSNWNRDQNGFMSRSGTICGIQGIRPPRQLEVTPYVLSSLTDPPDPTAHGFDGEERDRRGNFGADLKYGVTADLTLNAAFQPDFGQVEADPSSLNLSPYETYYEEKRPFFIEGAQFFWHPDFTVFYSRRIGTGSENSRIRYAGKLTGKVAGDVSTAVLVAATDEAEEGRAHNPFRAGRSRAVYAIGRFGKEFGGGMHSVHVMQTAVVRDPDSFGIDTRNGYTTGGDFELNFKDRMYQVTGSFVGSIVDYRSASSGTEGGAPTRYGTGTRFEIEKMSGDWRFALTTRHQSDELDINDLGYITDPNHYAVQGWVTRVFNADDDGQSRITSGQLHLRYYQNWIYAGRTFMNPGDAAKVLWSYARGHGLSQLLDFEASLTTRDCWSAWCGLNYSPDGTSLYNTRSTPDGSQRGPLMTNPAGYSAYVGMNTDTRKKLGFEANLEGAHDTADTWSLGAHLGASWVQSDRLTHSLSANFSDGHADAQWIGNRENPGGGIGDVSYLFAELDQRTWDLTLRSSVLFSRNTSLELYCQPFLTVGEYANPRELARPDSYDLRPFEYDAAQSDFSYGAVNLNLVYRWEYRPGSTIYLVWAHTRERYDARGLHGPGDPFRSGFQTDPLFDGEGGNRFLVKVSYWIPV